MASPSLEPQRPAFVENSPVRWTVLYRPWYTGRSGAIISGPGADAVPDPEPFRDLMARVRDGDQQAAADLVRALEPELRRAVRVRLSDPRLRRTVDSVDVCQSVLANFFV